MEAHVRKAGEFDFLERVYVSAEGTVYRARDKAANRTVAIKQRYTSELGKHGDLWHEAKLLSRANEFSSHIVQYLGAFEAPRRTLNMVLEWADGGDVGMVVKRRNGKADGALAEMLIWAWLADMFKALSALHSAGIIHRDVKCANLLLFRAPGSGTLAYEEGATPPKPLTDGELAQYHLKLGDLGVARECNIDVEATLAKTFYGTPLYLSPEMLSLQGLAPGGMRAASYGTATDMWSAGVVAYELATFETPFAAPSLQVLASKIAGGRFKPLPSTYSRRLQELVSGCLHLDPHARLTAPEALSMCMAAQMGELEGALLHVETTAGQVDGDGEVVWSVGDVVGAHAASSTPHHTSGRERRHSAWALEMGAAATSTSSNVSNNVVASGAEALDRGSSRYLPSQGVGQRPATAHATVVRVSRKAPSAVPPHLKSSSMFEGASNLHGGADGGALGALRPEGYKDGELDHPRDGSLLARVRSRQQVWDAELASPTFWRKDTHPLFDRPATAVATRGTRGGVLPVRRGCDEEGAPGSTRNPDPRKPKPDSGSRTPPRAAVAVQSRLPLAVASTDVSMADQMRRRGMTGTHAPSTTSTATNSLTTLVAGGARSAGVHEAPEPKGVAVQHRPPRVTAPVPDGTHPWNPPVSRSKEVPLTTNNTMGGSGTGSGGVRGGGSGDMPASSKRRVEVELRRARATCSILESIVRAEQGVRGEGNSGDLSEDVARKMSELTELRFKIMEMEEALA